MNVRDRVVAILAAQAMLEPSDIKADDTLESLGIDSMAVVESIFSIEEEFDISIPFNANEPNAGDFDISSVNSIVAAVERLVAARD